MTKQHAYITTAIPYVNGLPHIGHAMDYMLADVWARYQRQNGREVRFQTGVDEHGNKIAAKAASQNQTPQAYVDQMHGNFQNMIAELNISATDFIRTTDPHHVSAVQYIWQRLAIFIKTHQTSKRLPAPVNWALAAIIFKANRLF